MQSSPSKTCFFGPVYQQQLIGLILVEHLGFCLPEGDHLSACNDYCNPFRLWGNHPRIAGDSSEGEKGEIQCWDPGIPPWPA